MTPTAILLALAELCRVLGDNGAFWILTSAASHIQGFRECDSEGSTAEAYFWGRP